MKKRILALFAALVMLVCLLASCADSDVIKSSKEDSKVVGTCGDYEVKYQELRYLTMTYKELMAEKYGEQIFSATSSEYIGDYVKELEETVARQLTENYASLAEFEKNNIKTDDEETKKYVDGIIKENKELLGGTEAYKEYVKECYMTDEVVRFNYALEHCFGRYYDLVAQKYDKEAYDAVMSGEVFIRVRSILIRNDEGEDFEKNRADAEMVRAEIAAGVPLKDYIGTKYNQDGGNCDYYLMRGYFEEAYENAAFALEIGEVSPVVETSEGFYIIQRVEPDEAYFELNMDACKQTYILSKMYEKINANMEKMQFKFNDYGKTLNLWTMK
ncbi:MAG: peptidylprolyl isomerase [Clostridia bacterium]|nr:peptidylprolyl isomerase [Clostridia bacterium]